MYRFTFCKMSPLMQIEVFEPSTMNLPFISDWLGECFALHQATETEQQQLEIQGKQGQILDAILSASPHPFYILDRAGRFLYANRVSRLLMSKILQNAEQLELSDIVGKTGQELGFTSEIIAFYEGCIEKVLATNQPLTDEISYSVRGDIRYYEYTFSPIYDNENRIDTVIVTSRDITERKQVQLALEQLNEELVLKIEQYTQEFNEVNQRLETEITERYQLEESLRETEKQYCSVVETVQDVIFQTDATGLWIFLNPAWTTITGFSIADCIGKSFVDYVHPSDRQRHEQDFQTFIKERNDYFRQEICYLTQTGEERWFEVFSELMLDDEGVVIGTSGTLKDISDVYTQIHLREQAEAQVYNAQATEKEFNALKSRFLGMISHEFRTPLTTILSSTGLLKRYHQKLTEEKKLIHLDRIQSSVEHMTQMLNDILLLGQTEPGKLEVHSAPLNLIKFCRKLVGNIQVKTDTKPTINFQTQFNPSLENQSLEICLDEKILDPILTNLLSNAIKYSPSNSTVNFELIYQKQEVIFKIQDAGIGIPDEDQLRLFESFHRGNNVGTIPGTGLGLAIVKNLVDLQGGKITVESQVGVGTTVTVTLPTTQSS
ncbi:MAG TPA: hypothetical protein DCY91_07510 [Cyanobacteria bacterium UBA11370]|nr:hypothetical protein [Cyanobacteria bacterium UBA11370]